MRYTLCIHHWPAPMLRSPLGLLGVLSLPAPVLELRIRRLGASALDSRRTRTRRKRLGTVYLALRIFINIKLRLFSLSLFSLFCLLQLSLFRLHAFLNHRHMVVYLVSIFSPRSFVIVRSCIPSPFNVVRFFLLPKYPRE